MSKISKFINIIKGIDGIDVNDDYVLIYHFSLKNNKWYDDTSNIKWIGLKNNSWCILYKNSSNFYLCKKEKY